MENTNLSYTCYVFVSNMLSDRAIGVQGAHAVAELSILGDPNYENYVRNHKRMIFLNGGSTNKNRNAKGTLNKLLEEIMSLNVCKVGTFYEESIGDQLTAFAFVVDERINDHYTYPLFEQWLNKNNSQPRIWLANGLPKYDKIEDEFPLKYEEYLDIIGGEYNYELKKILANARTI